MSMVAESNVLLRERAPMPSGFKVATQDSYSGWKLMRSGGVSRLAKKIQTRGWSFVSSADGLPRSGVGKTSEEAIDSAITQVLQRVDSDSSAVEVERIELTQYPWFYLARVSVHPYRIAEGAAELSPNAPAPTVQSRVRTAARSAHHEGQPQMNSAMPSLKEMLIAPLRRTAQV